MKAETPYRITAIRVVEFHNLGTTTVELPEGGHLFLLGDNGSGKTTLLDAVHLVLTGGNEMELNSAARVAGAKGSGGRSIQGIVLRYNAITGKTMREAGITYAALEFRSGDAVVSLVVGLSAQGMDVAFDRWGGIASVPVKDLPLVLTDDGKLRAATFAELKRLMNELPGGTVFAHISDYLKAAGKRIFGGDLKYANVRKLLATGKAYREIAARAANYDDLFRNLLEEPNRDIFEALLKGLQDLDGLQSRLQAIQERQEFLQKLQSLCNEASSLTIKKNVVEWAEANRQNKSAKHQITEITTKEKDEKTNLESLQAQIQTVHLETERARERLQDLRLKDATGLVQREKGVQTRLNKAQVLAQNAKEKALQELNKVNQAQKNYNLASKKRNDFLREKGEELQRLNKGLNLATGELSDYLLGADNSDWDEVNDFNDGSQIFDDFLISTKQKCDEQSQVSFRLRSLADEADSAEKLAREKLATLRSQGEVTPEVKGFIEARKEIKNNLLQVRPVYELLEPSANCDRAHLALLERWVGDDFLSTFLTSQKESDNVKRIVWRINPGLTVCNIDTLVADVVALVPWLGKYIDLEKSDIAAIKLLARHLVDAHGCEEAQFLQFKTWQFRGREGVLESLKPRLIGTKAREAEQARLEHEAMELLATAEKDSKQKLKAARNAEDELQKLRQLIDFVQTTKLTVVRETNNILSLFSALKNAQEIAKIAETNADERTEEFLQTQEELQDIQCQMRAAGIDSSLEKRIASAEKAIQDCSDKEDNLHRQIGKIEEKLEHYNLEFTQAQQMLKLAQAECTAKVAMFAPDITDEAKIEAFVLKLLPTIQKENLQNLHEKFATQIGVTNTKIEQNIRSEKGVTYAFVYQPENLTLCDRQGKSLNEVLGIETEQLEKLQGMFGQKTREVFENIFMGEVMQQLYRDLRKIEDLVRRIHSKLVGRHFGSNRYDFGIKPVPEYEGFVALVRKGYRLDADNDKSELRAYLEQHREEIINAEFGEVPEIFDYRKWFKFELKVVTENEEGRAIDRKVKSMGSGGEQAVPNYLLILTVAEFLYHGGEFANNPKTAPLLFDEAFYGIDSARRDQLLAFADDLGLQLFVSSPDQDGVKRELRNSVSLIVIKDQNLDVHLSPIQWRNTPRQGDLFDQTVFKPSMQILEETR